MIYGILVVCILSIFGVWYTRHHSKNKPVYRVDVLRYANKHQDWCLCYTIHDALVHFGIDTKEYGICESVRHYFPEFTNENAIPFGATDATYWWTPNVWKDRAKFLEWLIKFYENDKTDLRTYKEEEND